MNPADLGHRQQSIPGGTTFRPTPAQGFHRDAGTAPSLPAIQTVVNCVQVTTFCVSRSSFGGGRRWG